MAATRGMLTAAMEHYQAGRLQQAEQTYRQILQTAPEHAEALYFLGLIGHQVGNNQTALDFLSRSIASESDAAAPHCMIATVYLAVGRTEEAIASCRQALLLRPDYAQAHHNLGIALQTQGNVGEAVSCYRQALILKPDSPETLNNLGGLFHAGDQLDEAVTHYRKALELNPKYAEAHSNLGNTLAKQGKYDEAVACYRRALEIRPDFAEVHNNLGMTLQDQGDLDAAVASFQQAIEIRPNYAEAFNNLGYALTERGNLNEAVAALHHALQHRANYADALNNLGTALRAQGRLDEAEKSLNMALQARPDFPEAHSNLGIVLKGLKRHDEALACFRRALQIKPDSVEVLNNLGLTLEDRGRYEEALETYRRLVKLQPSQLHWELRRVALCCPEVLQSSEDAAEYRRRLEADLQRFSLMDLRIPPARLASLGSKPPFHLMYHGRDDRAIKEAYAGIFRNSFPQAAPKPGTGLPRIGFLVTKEHEGIFLRCMRGVLQRLDPEAFELVVICSLAGSAMIRNRIENESVRIVVIPERLDRIVEIVRTAALDVLYYWEVGSDTTNYFLPFFRLAPVQCTSWGMPVTSGIPQVDYYLSDELVEPEDAQEHYSERLVRAATLLSYQERVCLPESPRRREDFGFKPQQHLYVCPQNVRKLHPDFDPLIGSILRRDPLGVVVITEDEHGYGAQKLRNRFAKTLAKLTDRIVFLPRQPYADYLSLIAAADVVLDPLHFGGAVTTYDVLSLNQPLVTLPSGFRRGRFTLGCYRKMGLTECVAADEEDYVEKAVRLGTDPDYRLTVIEQIRRNSPLLFEDQQVIQEYERILQRFVEEARAHRTPNGATMEPSKASKTVLHVGCGCVDPERLHSEFRGPLWKEIRLDANPAVSPDIVASMTDMQQVADGSVDAVWSSHGLEHLYAHEVPLALKEFLRVLTPGGLVLLSLPDLQAACRELAEGNAEDPLYVSSAGPISTIDMIYGHRDSIARGNHLMAHKTGFTAATLRKKLEVAGFQRIDVQRQGWNLWARAYK